MVFLLFLGRLIVRGTFFNLFFDTREHFLDLCDAGFQFGRITVPLVVGEGTLETVPRIFPFLQKHVAEGYPIEGITLLVVIAYLQLFLVERDALAVMAQIEMTLSIRKIVETAFMRGIDVKFGDDRIKTGRCLLVVPLVIVADAQVGLKSRIQFVFIVQFLEKQQSLVVFPRREILHGPSKLFRIFRFLAALGINRHDRQKQEGDENVLFHFLNPMKWVILYRI